MRDLEPKEVEFSGVAPQPRLTLRLLDVSPIVERVKEALWQYWLGLAGAAVGVGIGLYIGWVAWPVEWTQITFTHLEKGNQVVAVEVMADLNAYGDGRPSASLLRMAAQWSGVESVACGMATNAIEGEDYEQAARFIGLAYSIAGDACGMESE